MSGGWTEDADRQVRALLVYDIGRLLTAFRFWAALIVALLILLTAGWVGMHDQCNRLQPERRAQVCGVQRGS